MYLFLYLFLCRKFRYGSLGHVGRSDIWAGPVSVFTT